MSKVCHLCKISKKLEDFGKHEIKIKWGICKECARNKQKICRDRNPEKYKTRHNNWCKNNRDKTNKYSKKWISSNKEKHELIKQSNHLKKYNISIDDFNLLIKKQNNLCAICKNPETAIFNKKIRKLAVDHCHKTLKIRGLLCGNCNIALGKFKDSVEILESAISYLKEYG